MSLLYLARVEATKEAMGPERAVNMGVGLFSGPDLAADIRKLENVVAQQVHIYETHVSIGFILMNAPVMYRISSTSIASCGFAFKTHYCEQSSLQTSRT